MKGTSTILVLAAFISIISCKENKEETTTAVAKHKTKAYTQLKKAGWLLGKWGNNANGVAMTENWVQVNDSVFSGESYVVVNKDTVFAETVKLDEASGKMAYTVSVPGQNKELPVRFEMTSIDDKQMVFENPAHDYPNRITYSKITNDSLVAEISGVQKGKPASQQFAMSRLK
jgi:hypothetical protein